MRFTLDIADALGHELREKASRLDLSLKSLINRILAAGLKTLDEGSPRKRYKATPKATGFVAGIDIHKLNQLAEEIHDEELIDKLRSRN